MQSEGLTGHRKIRLVMYVHNLTNKVKGNYQYPSLDAIGQQFVREVKHMRGNISDSPCCTGCISPWQSDMKILEFAADGSMNHKQIQDMFGMELGTLVQRKKQDKDNSGPLTVYHITSMEGHYPHRSRQQQENSDHTGTCRPV